ncbi:MAG TPA: lipocalin family protein [Candidatus Brocadiia bacterium]|nr:lipocalin family protein [Candidatus Brocadiia bacterium]
MRAYYLLKSVPKPAWCVPAAVVICILQFGCVSKPSGLEVVRGFNADRYLGTWHEVARMDHSFERGLDNVTAEYSRRPGGGLNVVNRGYDAAKGKWREASGVAFFRGKQDIGSLKVSFFRPFYGTYDIISLDHENYGYAIVAGPDRSYLWILSRKPALDPELLNELVGKARELGFNTDALIYVRHDKTANR